LADFGSGDSILAFKKIQGIKVRVQVMLGETKLSVSQLAGLKKGDFVQLDTKVGETVNIFANGALIARGEIAVEDEEAPRFGITLTEIVDSSIASS
jgi:flagellar motor switch protein FliN/FliY